MGVSRRTVTYLALVVLTLTLLAEVHGGLVVKRFWVKDVQTSFLTAVPRVFPEEVDAKVQFWLINDESTTWPVGTVVVLDTDSAQGWTATNFVNNGSVAGLPVGSGEVAYFEGKITAPQSPSTIGIYTLTFKVVVDAAAVETFDLQLETSCDDGSFCNGTEVWVEGTCVSTGVDPCYTIDPSGCTTIICDEDTARCSYQLDPGCEVCTGCIPNCTLPEGGQKQCGTDGCGGNCGTCADDLSCVEGACSSVAAPGTCANPLIFFAEGATIEGRHTLSDDTSNGVYQVTPDCNQGTTAKGLIYKMVIPDGPSYGMMAQLTGFDSVLDVRKDTCRGTSVVCNDDATPPGDYGSRVQIMLDPGVYYILITGYNEENVGPFNFFADFYPNCQPRCNSLFCGDNGCGGDCGPCAEGETCTESNKCFPDSCTPNCTGKECGDDGCGGECGDGCPNGELCVRGTGQCEVFEECNFALPTCSPACGADEFCGTDCVCHNVTEGLPDLVISTELLASQVHYQTQQFAAGDCAVVEGCILAPGDRKLIRFTIETANQGQATLELGDPSLRPDIFVWSPCHGHFHFAGYASYKLLSAEEPYEEIASGHKQGYCVYDAYRRLSAPGFSCSTELSCGDQGVQPGWVDNYGWSLDCQWLDITNVPAGNYLLFVEINGPRKIVESSYDNNKAYVPVTITDSPASSLFSHSLWSFFFLFW